MVAALDPESFWRAQHDFVRRENYEPLLRRLNRATGLDLSRLSGTLQEALWSTAIQHGPYRRIIDDAVLAWSRQPEGQRSEADLLRQIYIARGAAYDPDARRYRAEGHAAQGYYALERLGRGDQP